MSYLKPGDHPLSWMPAPLQRSVARAAGCVQCGRQLEMNGQGKYDLSGKCGDCANPFSEDEEGFDDLEF